MRLKMYTYTESRSISVRDVLFFTGIRLNKKVPVNVFFFTVLTQVIFHKYRKKCSSPESFNALEFVKNESFG